MKKNSILRYFIPIKSVFRRRPFYTDLVTAFALILILSVLSISWFGYIKGSKAVIETIDDILEALARVTVERVLNYLHPASNMAEMTGRIMEQTITDKTNTGKNLNNNNMITYMTEVLRIHRQFSTFFFGNEKGDFIMASRQPDTSIWVQIIDNSSKTPSTTWIKRNTENEIVSTETSHEIDFDPRTRPWYLAVKNSLSPKWSDIYIFHNNKKPGITSSFPILDENKKLTGVIGIDIELSSISAFLHNLTMQNMGTPFIINEKKQVIAFPTGINITTNITDNEQSRLLTYNELNISYLNKAVEHFLQTGNSKFSFKDNNIKYYSIFATFPTWLKEWKLGIIVRADNFLAPLGESNTATLIISIVVLFISIFICIALSRDISKPIIQLAEETKKIKRLSLDETISLKSHVLEIQLLRDALSAMKKSLKAFSMYVPSGIVKHLLETGEEAKIGGDKKDITISFSDIQSFTAISEHMSPEDLMNHLSTYFEELTSIIRDNKGTIDKYIGDAIMAFWGAPVANPNHAYHACKTALLCKEKINELNSIWIKDKKPPLHTRFGIHTGSTIVGNIGSSERINYSVLGDNVNIASRLENLNKIYGSSIIVTNSTKNTVKDSFLFRDLGKVVVKGKTQFTDIYELIDEIHPGLPKKLIDMCENFNKAIQVYYTKQWDKALKIFDNILKDNPTDQPTKFFIKQCKNNLKNK